VLTGLRISDSAHEEWFSAELKSILAGIKRRLQKLYVEPSHLEPWQATDYGRDGKFDLMRVSSRIHFFFT
jgi:hypothetical protein